MMSKYNAGVGRSAGNAHAAMLWGGMWDASTASVASQNKEKECFQSSAFTFCLVPYTNVVSSS